MDAIKVLRINVNLGSSTFAKKRQMTKQKHTQKKNRQTDRQTENTQLEENSHGTRKELSGGSTDIQQFSCQIWCYSSVFTRDSRNCYSAS